MMKTKLGLALAGGGFRASLFHVGVLRRMAEMDLLRYVHILSTVSGGSIVGALYILLLKRRLEDPKHNLLGPKKLRIDKSEYEAIVNELQTALVAGIRKNLRTRLIGNPLTLLKVMLLKGSLAEEMGRLYEKHIFATAIDELRKLDPKVKIVDDSNRIPLTAIRIRKDQVKDSGGTEQYNDSAVGQEYDRDRGGPGSAATRLILNTTSLNSGARFWFSSTELGDWYLGHIRYDEIDTELLPRKIFRDLTPNERGQLIDAWPNEAERATRWDTAVESFAARYGKKWDPDRTEFLKAWGECSEHKMKLELVHWLAQVDRERTDLAAPMPCFKRRKAMKAGEQDNEAEMPLPWDGPLDASEFRALLKALLNADAGRLRDAKNYAWYLAKGRSRKPRVDAGMDDPTLWVHFWDALKSIDEPLALRLEEEFNKHQKPAGSSTEPDWCKQLLDGVLEVYFCKTAAVISPNIRDEWDRRPLADAVAASAAFPPVFPPYQLYDLYDDMHVQVLSLSDGGAFDNIGVTALLDEHCNYVIASDTSAPFDTRQSKAAVGRIGLMRRLSNLLMNRPAQLYRHDLNERRRLGRAVEADTLASKVPQAVSQFAAARELKGLASFHIGSPRLTNDSPPSVEPDLIARLRTDLDIFGDAEIKCLINEGYVIADQYLRTGLKGSPFDPASRVNGAPSWPPVKSGPLTSKFEKEHLENILKVGKHRLFRALRLIEPVSLLVVGVAAVALVWVVWFMGWEWSHVNAAVNKLINWVVTKLLTWGWLSALSAWLQSIPLKYALPIVILLPVVWWSIKECLDPWVKRSVLYMRSDKSSMWRKILLAWKTLKGIKGNLLWLLFKLLPVVVLVVAPVAWVSHFFAWRFRRKTKDPVGLDK